MLLESVHIANKLGKGISITKDVLLKVCETRGCKLEDIIEIIED